MSPIIHVILGLLIFFELSPVKALDITYCSNQNTGVSNSACMSKSSLPWPRLSMLLKGLVKLPVRETTLSVLSKVAAVGVRTMLLSALRRRVLAIYHVLDSHMRLAAIQAKGFSAT
ncbi:MAG: hypothetical protein M1827_006669 [Pycnora praestabilis]|nr:MAG: hypothetical protein M1827_006669 [Pycnora praestabilis]